MSEKKPTKIRATPKAHATKRQLLAAALKLFQKKGFKETTMRDIAQEAGVAVGAAYYYFKTKDELVFAFYEETVNNDVGRMESLLKESNDLSLRIKGLIRQRCEVLKPYRSFLGVLSEHISPTSPISPFGPATKKVREEAIAMFAEILEGTKLSTSPLLRPYLPQLIWLYYMGILFFWIHDESPESKKTAALLDSTLPLFLGLLKLSALPLMAGQLKPIIPFLKDLA